MSNVSKPATAAPVVSVVMPAFNAASFVQETLESVLSQTFADFEIIVVDDASTDHTWRIIEGIADTRIVSIRNPAQRGQAASLNIGIEAARGQYIARIDADDIALPTRLEKQYHFLENNLDIGLVGSNVVYFYMDGSPEVPVHFPCEPVSIKLQSLFTSPFSHPAVMIRRSVLDLLNLWYNPEYEGAEDYELWTRILQVTKGSNIPEVLLRQRRHAGSVTHRTESRKRQLRNAYKAMRNIQLKYRPDLSEAMTTTIWRFLLGDISFYKVLDVYELVCNSFQRMENNSELATNACDRLIIRTLKHDCSRHPTGYLCNSLFFLQRSSMIAKRSYRILIAKL
jgi:glycosyltransferase involved in cell wall biosynthesis